MKNEDIIEQFTIDRAKELFGAKLVILIQVARQIQFICLVLILGNKILTLSLVNGGHFTHGHSKNSSDMPFIMIFLKILGI